MLTGAPIVPVGCQSPFVFGWAGYMLVVEARIGWPAPVLFAALYACLQIILDLVRRGDRASDQAELLALRHQLRVLARLRQSELGSWLPPNTKQVRLRWAD